tara:strand:- start:1177 stop:1554 length:378 start_codon:yes stop_codon:yes gene_type:complete
MKQIKDYELQTLKSKCIDLLSRTYLELGQKSDAESLVMLSSILATDLLEDFGTLTMEDIYQAFRQGIRNTDNFHINVKTYYKWIKAHRQLIWDNVSTEPKRIDKRLKYRLGGGMKSIELITKKLK